ncbi:MAG: BlaI/MecI/CopY family transcriptional regulator [Microscillaceae bacterium]|jgi:predicted transcriptional regulator|nr:BlaI/MecI/CopY family transcriptional regulator [Microscillaceae bacterium]
MIKPTEAELEVLQILWKYGPSNVRFVNEAINQNRAAEGEVGYTTTLKVMQIMFEKGILKRDDSARTHVYQAAFSEESTQKSLVDKLLDTAFGGSALKLVMQALGNRKTSQKELQEIKNLLNKIEQEKGGEQ